MAALRGVRSDPVLAAWFRPDDVGETLALALDPEVLVDLGAALSGDADAAGWTVRTIVSLLANPAGDDATERRLIDEFLVPVVLPGASVRGTGARRDGAGRVGGGTRRAGR